MAVGKDIFKIGLGGIIDELRDWNVVKSKIQKNPYSEKSFKESKSRKLLSGIFLISLLLYSIQSITKFCSFYLPNIFPVLLLLITSTTRRSFQQPGLL